MVSMHSERNKKIPLAGLPGAITGLNEQKNNIEQTISVIQYITLAVYGSFQTAKWLMVIEKL